MEIRKPQPRVAIKAGSQNVLAIWLEGYIAHLSRMTGKAPHLLVTVIVYPLMRFFNRLELEL
jgi:hypothetical protein